MDRPKAEQTNAAVVSDRRKAYEAPRVVIKRSVANATLLTAPGPSGSTLTASG
jgi:hypothetical protein